MGAAHGEGRHQDLSLSLHRLLDDLTALGERLSQGPMVAVAGLFFHYCIAFIWAAIFFQIYPRISFLAHNRLVTGLLLGLFIWLVMNLVVLPLSNVPPLRFNPVRVSLGIVILMLCVGLPITWLTAGYYARKAAKGNP